MASCRLLALSELRLSHHLIESKGVIPWSSPCHHHPHVAVGQAALGPRDPCRELLVPKSPPFVLFLHLDSLHHCSLQTPPRDFFPVGVGGGGPFCASFGAWGGGGWGGAEVLVGQGRHRRGGGDTWVTSRGCPQLALSLLFGPRRPRWPWWPWWPRWPQWPWWPAMQGWDLCILGYLLTLFQSDYVKPPGASWRERTNCFVKLICCLSIYSLPTVRCIFLPVSVPPLSPPGAGALTPHGNIGHRSHVRDGTWAPLTSAHMSSPAPGGHTVSPQCPRQGGRPPIAQPAE